jgi:serine phosphatase RsbU (regulator of sigma subunit)
MLLKSEYDRVRTTAATPAAVLEQLNARIYHRYPKMDLQCTASCVDIVALEDGGARVIYAAAACPPFLHITSAGTRELILPGPYLGVLDEVTIDTAEVRLRRGERFVVYTDGLYEEIGAGGEMYGSDQLLADMTLDVPLDAVPGRVQAAVEAFGGSRKLVDDVTMVVVEAG